jgi:hypothetical protein
MPPITVDTEVKYGGTLYGDTEMDCSGGGGEPTFAEKTKEDGDAVILGGGRKLAWIFATTVRLFAGPDIEMVPRSGDTPRSAAFALTVRVAGVTVCEAVTDSQFAPLSVLVVTEIGTGSALLVTVRDNGSVDPGLSAKNHIGCSGTLMTGPAVTFKVTLAVAGTTVAPGLVGFTVMVPLYTPASSEEGSTFTAIYEEPGHPAIG